MTGVLGSISLVGKADGAYQIKLAANDTQVDSSSIPLVRLRVRFRLERWQTDADLASIRDPKTIAKLPVEEQQACAKLWADVEKLIKKAQAKAK